ncbi:hypothetical protein FK268_09195 [Tsukamurella sputi]|uniref:Major capsid protein n=1 Tax=Tsukamurella sputi TaxID=2591848 RepID=A0A5C5RQT2_9ACTN|nr:major capsid protein [Tsukamurella sputi]TWS25357.1 hypothetical protein FK268_09195 [Tsukamurella sputi]
MANPTLPVQYPLGPPQVSGSTLTVDTMLREPTRITRYISDLSLQRFFADQVFSPIGGVSGGAILYTQLTYNDLYSTRDVANVAPGAEFPIVSADRPTPQVAQVEKFGGKFAVTDEARDRNDPSAIQMESMKLANTINRKLHQRAVATLNAAITSDTTVGGNNWASVVTSGTSQATAQQWPAADLAKAQLVADRTELGVDFNLLLVNPQEKANFDIIYGASSQSSAAVLAAYGLTMFATNRVAPGTAYLLASGQVGVMGVEKPISTETWREAEEQVTWVQTDVRPVFAVTNPYSVVKLTGIGPLDPNWKG